MPQTGDNVALEYAISREDADRFAAASQARYQAALQAGVLDDEILAIDVPSGRKGQTHASARRIHDRNLTWQHCRGCSRCSRMALSPQATLRESTMAPPQYCWESRDRYSAWGQPMARILSSAVVGVEPRIMGIGPHRAIEVALQRAGISLAEVDLIEINEAFAPQVLSCLKALELSFDDPRVNPNGGAIAIGHPLGASGARLVLSACRTLQRNNLRYAVVSLCVGVGQGVAMVIERV